MERLQGHAHRMQLTGERQAKVFDKLFDNFGANAITANRIDGNLQCKENVPNPVGGSNLVKGNAEDQCELLAV